MKIFITESQFKRIIEAVDLNGSFTKLKVGDILVLSISSDKGDFDYKFKVVKDMGDSWMLSNFNVGSVNTGFDFYVKKNENINDAKVVMVKVSKKDKSRKELNATIKNIKSAKIGDDVLDLAKIEKSYDAALIKIEKAEPNIDNESAHNKAVAVIKNQFGDIPEVEIVDNAGYGRVNRGGKSGNLNPEDTEFTDVSDLDALVNNFKKEFKADQGVRFTLKENDSLSVINFNVLSISGNSATIKLIETDNGKYDMYRKGKFTMNFDRKYVEVNGPNNYDITLIIEGTEKEIPIKNVVKIEATSKNDDEVKISKEMLLKYIQSDPVLMNAFAKTPMLMGLINVGDVRGLSKAYELLNKSGFGFGDSDSEDIKTGNFSDKFTSRRSAKIRLLKDANFSTGPSIVADEKRVTVDKSRNSVILKDSDGNTYKILKDLGGDKYAVNAQRKGDDSGVTINIKVLDYTSQ
jgi:hypothetical protein